MNNATWSPEELKIISDAVVGRTSTEALVELLPGRTVRAIQKKLRRDGPDQREHARLLMLDPDDDGEADGELERRKVSAKLGSEALLRRLRRAGFAR